MRMYHIVICGMSRSAVFLDLSDLITSKKGLRQGDSLACLLLNLALEKGVRNAGIQKSGTIFYKSVQLLTI